MLKSKNYTFSATVAKVSKVYLAAFFTFKFYLYCYGACSDRLLSVAYNGYLAYYMVTISLGSSKSNSYPFRDRSLEVDVQLPTHRSCIYIYR